MSVSLFILDWLIPLAQEKQTASPLPARHPLSTRYSKPSPNHKPLNLLPLNQPNFKSKIISRIRLHIPHHPRQHYRPHPPRQEVYSSIMRNADQEVSIL